MEDKIVLPAGISRADENWSDISIHQSAVQGHPRASLLKPHCLYILMLYEPFFAYKIWTFVVVFFPKMDHEN